MISLCYSYSFINNLTVYILPLITIHAVLAIVQNACPAKENYKPLCDRHVVWLGDNREETQPRTGLSDITVRAPLGVVTSGVECWRVVSWRSTDSCECDTLPRDDDPLNRRTLAIRWLFLAIRRLTWLSVVCNILIHVFTWRRSTSAFTRRTLAVVRLYRVSDTHINTWWWPTSALARLCRIDKNVRHSWCIMLLLSTLRCGNYVIIFTAGKSFRPSATNAQHLIKLCEFSRINRNICHF